MNANFYVFATLLLATLRKKAHCLQTSITEAEMYILFEWVRAVTPLSPLLSALFRGVHVNSIRKKRVPVLCFPRCLCWISLFPVLFSIDERCYPGTPTCLNTSNFRVTTTCVSALVPLFYSYAPCSPSQVLYVWTGAVRHGWQCYLTFWKSMRGGLLFRGGCEEMCSHSGGDIATFWKPVFFFIAEQGLLCMRMSCRNHSAKCQSQHATIKQSTPPAATLGCGGQWLGRKNYKPLFLLTLYFPCKLDQREAIIVISGSTFMYMTLPWSPNRGYNLFIFYLQKKVAAVGRDFL